MAGTLRSLLRRFGLDLTDYPKPHWQQIKRLLDHFGITLVLDVGANVGQYAGYLRAAGYQGRIVSFEPLADAHEALTRRAAGDAAWTVAPRLALGAAEGEIEINVSDDRDMSSVLPMRAEVLRASPSSRTVAREKVRLTTLDAVFADYASDTDRVLLKIDTQGYERQVLEGAERTLPRLTGIQLELSLVPLYEGETTWLVLIDDLTRRGFEPRLIIPGYFDRHLMRLLQVDGVFFRAGAAGG
ncbi:MAG TPA: FkbM family methyltransferase [Alphaproteobacteria bacterium]|nr:FkbM family methyltransferase [Alphaproteobacteria bacterium]